MSKNVFELSTENLYNRKWRAVYIVGYGAGIIAGDQEPGGDYICKGSAKEIAVEELMNLYGKICEDHNNIITLGYAYKKKKKRLRRLWNYLKWKLGPKFEYPNLPNAELDERS